MVIDADALNILSGQMETLSAVKGPRLLTPHPGEMKRLSPNDTRHTRGDCDQILSKLRGDPPL